MSIFGRFFCLLAAALPLACGGEHVGESWQGPRDRDPSSIGWFSRHRHRGHGPAAPAQGAVIGRVDGIFLSGNRFFIRGWACQVGVEGPLDIQLYVEGSSRTAAREMIGGESSIYMADKDVANRCKTQNTILRFNATLQKEWLEAHKGKRLFVYGIPLEGGISKAMLEQSGDYRLPAPISERPRGCMASPRATSNTRNAYPAPYHQGNGQPWTYVAWIWRDWSDQGKKLNHSLSVMRSKDLKTWYNTCGERISLPAQLDARTVVDPVPTEFGLMNAGMRLNSDDNGAPVISYVRYSWVDSKTAPPKIAQQVYTARLTESGWRVRRMTNWNTRAPVVVGSQPSDPDYFVAARPLRVLEDGTMVQSYGRAKADATGTPPSGVYVIEDQGGNLVRTNRRGSVRESDALLKIERPKPLPEAAKSSEPRPRPINIAFGPRRYYASYDQRWITLAADWWGEGVKRPGLYDRALGRFWLHDGANNRKMVRYGPNKGRHWPVIGRWGFQRPRYENDNENVLPSIGIFSAVSGWHALKYSLSGGYGDRSFVGYEALGDYQIDDSPRRWFKTVPSKTTFLKLDTLPGTNWFNGYDCDGKPINSRNPIPEPCRERFVSNLYLFRYDEGASRWQKELLDRAWGGSPTAIALEVYRNVYVAFYFDARRRPKVALRHGHGGKWQYKVLDTVFDGWDMHNFLTLRVDEMKNIHLSGNIHNDPLTYWRSKGLNVASIRRQPMVGPNEGRASYPNFFRGPRGDLFFTYRDGHAGNGQWFVNKYDLKTQTWSRWVSTFAKQ